MKHLNHIVNWTRVLLLAVALIQPTTVFGWGQTGHRVSAEIAQAYLTEDSKKLIDTLFPDASLAEISTYADEERANPSEFWQTTAEPWHFVTVKSGNQYIPHLHAPAQGDAYTALIAFRKTLLSKNASVAEKQLALHFTVHLIGDLHQPLHCGNGLDRGGNSVEVEFFWQKSNLHRVWDTGLIDNQQLAYTEWSEWLLKKISVQALEKWQDTDPKVWINESIELRNRLYPEQYKLSWEYQYQYLPAVKLRLQMAGVRIAAYLNELFKSP